MSINEPGMTDLTNIIQQVTDGNNTNPINQRHLLLGDVIGDNDSFNKYFVESKTAFEYGTAGFRMNSNLMLKVCFRIGILISLLSMKRDQTVGLMITASHNPECDNGLKIIEPNGEMLHEAWEQYATDISNCRSDDLVSEVRKIIDLEEINTDIVPKVFLAVDTRKSGTILKEAVVDGIKMSKHSEIHDWGELTTPQLHFFVARHNLNGGRVTEESDYFEYFGKKYHDFLELANIKEQVDVCVDGANGVGALKIQKLKQMKLFASLNFRIINSGGGKLNESCGADFVKLHNTSPENAFPVECSPGEHFCTFDGDADRILYYYFDRCKRFHLLDGDKMASLFCVYIKNLLAESDLSDEVTLGVVQTAYSNGNSTAFLRSMGIGHRFACTGVKNIHREAAKFSIGVYFEANGHGTVVVHPKVFSILSESKSQKLLCFLGLFNPYVGDAISDMIVTEAILSDMKMSMDEWDSLYTELPNLQSKLKVRNKSIFKPINSDTELETPRELQEFIWKTTGKYPRARAFVRPSGTEDIVRLYVEASCENDVNEITSLISSKILNDFN